MSKPRAVREAFWCYPFKKKERKDSLSPALPDPVPVKFWSLRIWICDRAKIKRIKNKLNFKKTTATKKIFFFCSLFIGISTPSCSAPGDMNQSHLWSLLDLLPSPTPNIATLQEDRHLSPSVPTFPLQPLIFPPLNCGLHNGFPPAARG